VLQCIAMPNRDIHIVPADSAPFSPRTHGEIRIFLMLYRGKGAAGEAGVDLCLGALRDRKSF
jgi:hypothetical protein